MSQNDPLLGSDWLEKEEPISGQSIHPINGINFHTINCKTEPISKTSLNYPLNEPNSVVLNHKVSHNSTEVSNNRTKDNSKQQLMSAIAMSSSESSSDDIVIPMQRRKIKTRFPRKRRSRSTDSNLSIKSRALISCPSICMKVVFGLLIVSSIGFTVLFIAKLYDRIDSLQTAINDLSISGNSVPQEMHSIHSHLKTLDTNVTTIGGRLVLAFDRIDNLTKEVQQMKILLTKISDSVEAAPAIRQLPKELQDLQKAVADMGSQMSTNDNEIKSVKDTQNAQHLKTQLFSSELSAIKANVTDLYQMVNSSVSSVKVDQNSRQLSEMSANFSILQLYYTNLLNWKATAEQQIISILALTQHIHDKLHNQSIVDSTGTATVTDLGISHNGSHNKKQTTDESTKLDVTPIETNDTTMASNGTLFS